MGDKNALTRRSFLSAAVLTGLGAGMVGLTGCAGQPATNTNAAGDSQSGATGAQNASSVYETWSEDLNPQDLDYTQDSGDLSHVLSSWTMGGMEFSNRIVKSAAGSGYIFGGWDCLVEYYERFALGGVEMIWVESLFHPFAPYENTKNPDVDQVADLYDFDLLISRVHDAGSKIGIQIDTSSSAFVTGLSTQGGNYAENLSAEDLRWAIERYIHSAQIVKELGFDACEINCAGETLPQWFLSGAGNHREDDYGPQSYENRARFVTDIIKGIHEVCGDDFPIEILMNGVEENDESLGESYEANTVEDGIELAKLFEQAGAAAVQVRLGPLHHHIGQFMGDLYFDTPGCIGQTGYGTQFDFSRHFQGKLTADHSGCGLMLDVAKEYKDALSIPVGTVTYMDPAHAPDFFDEA